MCIGIGHLISKNRHILALLTDVSVGLQILFNKDN